MGGYKPLHPSISSTDSAPPLTRRLDRAFRVRGSEGVGTDPDGSDVGYIEVIIKTNLLGGREDETRRGSTGADLNPRLAPPPHDMNIS
ncbi:hypothetical protein DSO57_1037979 [Entomophthora muscae]|uniref:Uncharacterized protein n=1 Tax=Entomophthora muscae TaxID=34485 RepID=A0ACC2SYV6_9FUNG|nr:hypothetical protein DSO57_1037979 [Entomophthora muscae]